jgi:hypothetical protein
VDHDVLQRVRRAIYDTFAGQGRGPSSRRRSTTTAPRLMVAAGVPQPAKFRQRTVENCLGASTSVGNVSWLSRIGTGPDRTLAEVGW